MLGIWKLSVPIFIFSPSKSKTLLENKIYFKKKKKGSCSVIHIENSHYMAVKVTNEVKR